MKKIFFIALIVVSSLCSAQQLEHFQEMALRANPGIRSQQKNLDITEEKLNEAYSFSDTEFGIGYFVSEPETRTGAQKLKISLRQMLPWFGTIEARKGLTNSLISIEEVQLEIAERKLRLEVAKSYFQLYELQEKQKVLQQNIELLERYRTMALNSLEVGKASAVEVLRLKMRQNDLIQQQKNFDLKIRTWRTNFSNLLHSEDTLEVNVETSLKIPPQPDETAGLQTHPELQQFDRFASNIENAENLNRTEAAPKLGIGLDYVSVQERRDIDLPDNGKDMLMPMLSFSVPVFNKKYRSVTRQNEIRQEQLLSQRAAVRNDLENRLSTALNKRASARISYNTQVDNLRQAKNAEDLLLKQYETGNIDFEDVLDIQEIQLQIQMDLIEAVSNWFIQDAEVVYLTIN